MIATTRTNEVLNEINKFKAGIEKSNTPMKNYVDKTCLATATYNVFIAAVETAYRDAARTFTGIAGKAENAKEVLAKKFQDYFKKGPCQTKNDFDNMHLEWCKAFLDQLKADKYTLATHGQAQKVVNMTFKYLYCLQDATTTYNKYFEYCHVALDSFTLEWIWRNCNPKGSKLNKHEAWSNLSEGDYLDKNKTKRPGYNSIVALYRAKIPSSLHPNCTPFQAEFIFWPEIQMHLATEAFYFALNDSLSNKEKENFKKKDLNSKKAEIKNHPNF